jgi:hypothetical protein
VSSATTATSATPRPTSTTIDSPIGAQAFQVYQHAVALLSQIEESPTGYSTDPRLGQIMIDPWYGEVRAFIDQLRLKRQVVKGPYSYAKFRLDDVTPDGRIIFTDCETNSQEIYNATTGAAVTNSRTTEIPEQVVVYHPSQSVWKVADLNTNTAGSAHACDA